MGSKVFKPKPRQESKQAVESPGLDLKVESKPENRYSDEAMTLKILTLGGSEHHVKAQPSWSVQQLIAELFEVLKLSESSEEMVVIALTFGDVELDPMSILTECGLCDGSETTAIVRKEPRPRRPSNNSSLLTLTEDDDIGVFESQKLGSPGSGWLRHNAPSPLISEVHDLISLLAGWTGAEYKELNFLGLEGLDKVRSHVDNLFEERLSKQDSASFDKDDFKSVLSLHELESLVGLSQLSKLVAIFGNEPDEIVVRRCQAHGRCINFHVDHSKKVMQVALNSDEEFRGGRLVFATDAGLEIPRRNVGTVTLHHKDIVHGVTELEEGVRYGLFFLDKTSKSL